MPSQSPAVTALPKGEPRAAPRYIVCWQEKWSVPVLIRSINCFMNNYLFRRGFAYSNYILVELLVLAVNQPANEHERGEHDKVPNILYAVANYAGINHEQAAYNAKRGQNIAA